MKKILMILLFSYLLFISNCKENPEGTHQTYTVSGSVECLGSAMENVTVSIDNAFNWTTTTNNSGYFKIQNVIAGNHTLVITKQQGDGSFSERSNVIAVYDDVELNNLKLPNPVYMYEPAEVTDNSIVLKWSPSQAADFREYKIYRHNTSGLDESTGTLAHVSTSITDTVFMDENLNPLQEYFYRVYVMNEYGRLGGSNIVQATTKNFNVIENGSFEVIDIYSQFPEKWENNTFLEIDSTTSVEGKYSFRFLGEKHPGTSFDLRQVVATNKIVPGGLYELSYWVKHDSLCSNFMTWTSFYPVTDHQCEYTGPLAPSDWVKYSTTFTVPLGTNPTQYFFVIYFWQIENDTLPSVPLNVWIDNIELYRIE